MSLNLLGDRPGYHCSACRVTYHDSLRWIDHCNSRSHLKAIGQEHVLAYDRTATLEEVRKRIHELAEMQKPKNESYDLRKNIATKEEAIEEEKARKREDRRIRRRQERAAKRYNEDSE
ncbi:hypothetical protein CANCADRAFT_2022 [Tortispora caseinolytica NRRL Y-17796]|uniref:U1-type domain-containing protein n=1 Tax=Tortispora caseinolytica NRRL Y-17796 TaxID=767744 RepID=A0A1E4TEU7_9ASCO|nr:hypothetical protein CANCADRAFT_2022 [Tortispora caseinolytica NRRL Y-17796]